MDMKLRAQLKYHLPRETSLEAHSHTQSKHPVPWSYLLPVLGLSPLFPCRPEGETLESKGLLCCSPGHSPQNSAQGTGGSQGLWAK